MNQSTYCYRRFCVCAIFAIILMLISGCQTDNKATIPFQIRIDNQKNIYQFSAESFVLDDIQSLKKNNLDLKIAQSRIDQSQALYTQAYAGYLPQVSADIATTHQEGANPFAMRPQIDQDFYSVNGNISFIPDFFGKTQLRTLIAKNQIQSTYFQAQSTYLDSLNGYVKNYHLVCATKALIDMNKNTVKINQNLVDSLKIRYELGRSNVVDYYNARDTLIASQIALDKAHQNYNTAFQGYYSLIGQSLNVAEGKTLCHNGFVPLPKQKIAITVHDLAKRPDIKVLEYRLKNASNAVDLSLKALYPDANVLFTLQNSVTSISDILDINLFAKNLTARLTELIYDGGVRDAQIDIAKSDFNIAEKTYYNSIITATNQLITLGKNLNLSIKLESDAAQRLTIATKALDAANRNYQFGTIDFTQRLNSQRNYYNAQIEWIANVQNTRNLYTDLLTASGISPIGI